jgi:DNA-binding XRE family transcriptional regulator
MSREKLAAANKILAGTIRRLRERLGELEGAEVTQEEMAHRLGAKVFPYQNWERGRTCVPGIYILRMLALCPDPDTQANFFVDIGEVSAKMFSTLRRESPKEQGEGAQARGMRYEQLPVKIPKAGRKR